MKKTATKNGKTIVTFELPPGLAEDTAALCGDFTDWTSSAAPMKRRKDGSFSVTVRLGPGRYRYRYLVDDGRWENDDAADDYEPNEFGSQDCVVTV